MTWTLRWGRVSHLRTYGTPIKTATGKGTCYAGECSLLQKNAGTHVSDRRKSDTRKLCFVLRWMN